MKASELVQKLSLVPHLEGGWYRELFRSRESVETPRGERCALTTIHYMLERAQLSRWHRVDSDEVWHFYDGSPLELFSYDPATQHVLRHVLGSMEQDHETVAVIPAGFWQAARSLGDFSLVGCTVGPGFVYEDFHFVAALPEHAAHFTGEMAPLKNLL